MSGLWAQLFGPKVMALLGLGCLGFGGLMIALHFSGQRLPPAPEREELQVLRGRVVVVSPASSDLYSHTQLRTRHALEGWQVLLDVEGGAPPVTVHIGDWPPFGSSRSLDLARVERLLPRGARVTAYVDEGPLVWQLESEGRVLVDFERRRAEHARRASRDVWLMILLPLLGLLLCGRAVFAWRNAPSREGGALHPPASDRGRV